MNNSNKYIGVFDSGVGGLTVVKSIIKAMPNESIIYLADSKHMPYGDKTDEQILSYVLDDVDFLNSYNLKAIVIACNTADAIASKTVREKMELPVFGVIESTAKKAASTTSNNKIGVIATSAAIKSNEYKRQINKYNPNALVLSQACPFLVPLIEEGKFDIGNEEMRVILEDYLTPLIEHGIDTLVLGCTHYELLANIILDMYPDLNIVSSSRCVADILKAKLEPSTNAYVDRQYFVSSNKDKFEQTAQAFMPDIEVKQI